MDANKKAITEIAKLIDEYKTEDSERGYMCRQLTAIFWKYGIINDVSKHRLQCSQIVANKS